VEVPRLLQEQQEQVVRRLQVVVVSGVSKNFMRLNLFSLLIFWPCIVLPAGAFAAFGNFGVPWLHGVIIIIVAMFFGALFAMIAYHEMKFVTDCLDYKGSCLIDRPILEVSIIGVELTILILWVVFSGFFGFQLTKRYVDLFL
jgi:hypothetical protein